MIQADLHLHTCYSHGRHTPWEMYVAARNRGLTTIGFSEHSPRPEGFDYIHEYRDQLAHYLPRYVAEVQALKNLDPDCQVLLGLEMDWLHGEEAFIRKATNAYDFDYLIGSVHFLDHWGFDDGQEKWQDAPQEVCDARYGQYFTLWGEMLASGLFRIAAHPDLIKIFSLPQFHIWLQKPESINRIRECLLTLKHNGMALEISSAGLRKACREIYPHPQIMALARELDIPISFASDAHCMNDVACHFEELAEYARGFGYREQTLFVKGKRRELPF